MTAFNERDSMITQTRQPFARRHNSSCVYYGIRGDRQKYMYDKSCVLEGAGLGVTRLGPGYAMPLGVVEMGPGYAMPLGEEVINPVGVLWNGAGLGMNQGSLELLGSSAAADADLVSRVLNTISKQSANALVVVSKSATSGAGEIAGLPYVMIDRDTFATLQLAMASTPGGTLIPKPITGELAEFLVEGGSQVGRVSSVMPILQAAENVLRARVGAPPVQRSTGMPTMTKVLLGAGALAIVGTVALIALTKPFTSDLHGTRPRRRRRRKS